MAEPIRSSMGRCVGRSGSAFDLRPMPVTLKSYHRKDMRAVASVGVVAGMAARTLTMRFRPTEARDLENPEAIGSGQGPVSTLHDWRV